MPRWAGSRWRCPEADGGLGCGFVETALVAEELGRALVLEPYIGCAVLAARLLERADAPAFAARRAAVAGRAWPPDRQQIALAHGEPDSRFELDAVGTTARAEGSGHVLDGTKLMVPAAATAGAFHRAALGSTTATWRCSSCRATP